jgi:hypothetical protein
VVEAKRTGKNRVIAPAKQGAPDRTNDP